MNTYLLYAVAGVAAWTIVLAVGAVRLVSWVHAHIDHSPFDMPEPPPADDAWLERFFDDIYASLDQEAGK